MHVLDEASEGAGLLDLEKKEVWGEAGDVM